MDVVYPELDRIAARHLRHERAEHSLQPTALVNEAYLRLAQHPEKTWQDRVHFFAVAAHVVRAVLVTLRHGVPDSRSALADSRMYLARALIDLAESQSVQKRGPQLDEARRQLVLAEPAAREAAVDPAVRYTALPGLAEEQQARLRRLSR
jgi:hypothetical protein